MLSLVLNNIYEIMRSDVLVKYTHTHTCENIDENKYTVKIADAQLCVLFKIVLYLTKDTYPILGEKWV